MATTGIKLFFGASALAVVAAIVIGTDGSHASVSVVGAALALLGLAALTTRHRDFETDPTEAAADVQVPAGRRANGAWAILPAAGLGLAAVGAAVDLFIVVFGVALVVAGGAGWAWSGHVASGGADPALIEQRPRPLPAVLLDLRRSSQVLRLIDVVLLGFGLLIGAAVLHACVEWVLSSANAEVTDAS